MFILELMFLQYSISFDVDSICWTLFLSCFLWCRRLLHLDIFAESIISISLQLDLFSFSYIHTQCKCVYIYIYLLIHMHSLTELSIFCHEAIAFVAFKIDGVVLYR